MAGNPSFSPIRRSIFGEKQIKNPSFLILCVVRPTKEAGFTFYSTYNLHLFPHFYKKRLISVSSQYPNNKRIHIVTFISNILYTTG